MGWIIDHDIYYKVSQNLIKYIKNGQLSDLNHALSIDIIKADDSIYTDYALLRLAIREKQIPISRYLINLGFRVNSEINFPFDTPLHEAIKTKNVEIIEMLMGRRASLRALNKDEKTPLQLAAEVRDHKIINLLLNNADDSYFDELKRYHQWTSLHIACAKNDKETVISLAKTTTEFNKIIGSTSPLWQGYTPLHIAVTCQYESIIEILLKHDIDLCVPDANGITSLHLADEFGLRNIERMLLESRCMRFDVNPQNKEGLTHFHIACMIVGNNQNVIKNFIATGAVDINARLNAKQIGYAGFTPLHICIQHSFSVGATILMQNGADLTIENSQRLTPFQMAFANNDAKMFKIFLDDKRIYKVDVQKESGLHKYLHDSCKNDYFDVVTNLLARGADPKINNPTHRHFAGYTTLHYAVERGNIEFIESVLKDPRTNINALNKYKKTPLHLAVRASRNDIVEMLLSNGASVIEKDDENQTAIQIAIQTARFRNDYSIVRTLLEALKLYFRVTQDEEKIWNFYQTAYETSDLVNIIYSFPAAVPVKSNTERGINDPPSLLKSIVLHLAAYKGDIDMMKQLLLDGVYVDVRNSSGVTPAHACIMGDNWSALTLAILLDAGANINVQTYNSHETPLHLALTKHKYDVMELLVNCGANLRLQNRNGITALHMMFGHKKDFDGVIEKLKESLGSTDSVDVVDKYGLTPLHYAVKNNCTWYVELLLHFKADPNRQNRWMQTPLHVACTNAELDVIQMLLKAGASVILTDQEGNLPLHKVVHNKCWKNWGENNMFHNRILLLYMKIFHDLLVAGGRDIDIDAKNRRGRSALKLALLENNHECAIVLEYCGANLKATKLLRKMCLCPIDLSEQHQIQLNVLGLKPCVGEEGSRCDHMLSTSSNLKYRERCLEELDKMSRDFEVNKYVSLRTVICSSPSDIARYSLHENVEKFIEDMTFFKTYPIFGLLIVSRLLYGRRIPKKVIQCAKYALSNVSLSLTKNGLPDACTEAILRKLTKDDLYNLADLAIIEEVLQENDRVS